MTELIPMKDNGIWTWHYENSEQIFREIMIVDQKPCGPFRQYHRNGNLNIKASFGEDGELNGKYEEYYSNGIPRLKCRYAEGVLTGVYETYYLSGNIHTHSRYAPSGMLVETQIHYYDTPNHQPHRMLTYVLGIKHGPVTEYFINGKVRLRAEYENGMLNGDYKSFHARTQSTKVACTFKNGQLHGIYRSYYPDGSLHQALTFNEGKPHGTVVVRHTTNKNLVCKFNNGIQVR